MLCTLYYAIKYKNKRYIINQSLIQSLYDPILTVDCSETSAILISTMDTNTRLARLTSAGSRKFCLRLLGCQPGCTIVYGRLKICAHYQGTGSRIFSDEKLPKLHSIPSILLNLPF